MPLEIVRNDLTLMEVDVLVKPTNPKVLIGPGLDKAIHHAAGPALWQARQEIGPLSPGQVALTPGFETQAAHILFAVSPVWQGGDQGEADLLAQTYRSSLEQAAKAGGQTMAFPLLGAGHNGFPKQLAMQIALQQITQFLMDNEMHVYLVVFEKEALMISHKLFQSVQAFIDDTYCETTLNDQEILPSDLGPEYLRGSRRYTRQQSSSEALDDRAYLSSRDGEDEPDYDRIIMSQSMKLSLDLDQVLAQMDAGFSETLMSLIEASGQKPAAIYKKANVDRKLFSKIRTQADYRPSKATALGFALALELDFDQTQDLIRRAGYTLTHSSKFDVIVEYCLQIKQYDVIEVNQLLFQFDQPLIGASAY